MCVVSDMVRLGDDLVDRLPPVRQRLSQSEVIEYSATSGWLSTQSFDSPCKLNGY